MAGSINFSANNTVKLADADTLLKANKRNMLISSAGMVAGYIGGLMSVDPESHKAIRNVQGFAIGLGVVACGMSISDRYFTVADYARRSKNSQREIDIEGLAQEGMLPTVKNMAGNFAKYALIMSAPAAVIRGGAETYKLYQDGTLGDALRSFRGNVADVVDDVVEEI
jgi:hypothetical protein